MSNVFNKELHQAIQKVYTDLEANELIQKNLEKAAKIGLYFAHGATEKAKGKLHTDQLKSKSTGVELAEAMDATEVCGNIVTAATAAANDAKKTNSTASTAAVNIQSAADSLTDLSADVAAILAVATVKDCGSKIQKLATLANNITRCAAKKAETTTLQSLNSTIEAAQSRAAVSLAQAKTLSNDIITLNKTLDDNFEALQTKISNDSDALKVAIANESEQDGIYKTALEEEKAMKFSEKYINKKVNSNLQYLKVGTYGEQFNISFNSFDNIRFVLNKGNLKKDWVLDEYRIIFTTLDDAAAFDIHAAKATPKGNYTPYKPTMLPLISQDDCGPSPKSIKHTVEFVTAEYVPPPVVPVLAPSNTPSILPKLNKAVDHTGQAVKRGVPYVAFVYVVYSCAYQNEMEDTDGYLSLASLPFTLQTDLPAANKPKLLFYQKKKEMANSCSVSNAMRVSFKVSNLMYHELDMSTIADFRVFLFNKNNQLANILNQFTNTQLVNLFALDEAYRLSEQKYLNAQQAYNTALATDSSDTKLINKLKKALKDAKDDFEKNAKNYNNQLNTIELVNEAKISNFFLDDEILKSIPIAFGENSKAVTKEFLEELLTQLELKTVERDGLANQLGEEENSLTERSNAKTQKEKTKSAKKTDIKNLENDISDLKILLKYDIRFVEIIDEILHILKHNDDRGTVLDLIGILLEFLDDEVIKVAIDIIVQIFEKQAVIQSTKDQIQELEKEINELETKITEIDSVINGLKAEIAKLEKEIAFLEQEYKDLSPEEDYKTFEELTLEITELKAAIKALKKRKAPNEEIESAELALKALEAKLDAVENSIEEEVTSAKSRAFTAINEKGDILDNYGEPLIPGNTYVALVFSVVKSSKPEAIPLFRTAYSDFSDGVNFDLAQL